MRIIFSLVAVLLYLVPALTQTREQIESRLSQFPPDQRAYERFRYWSTTQPADAQRGPDLMERYRAYLKAQGHSDADIESQIAIVVKRGSNLEVQRWNQILTSAKPMFNTNPNAFLVEM